MSLHVSSSIDDDGWWDKFVKNDDDYNNGSSFGNLRKFHDVCSFDFFNENENMSKGRFFQVCCFTWMQDFLRIIDGDSLNPKVTPKMLWKILKHIYISGCKEKSGIIKWILPDPSVMSVLKLTNHNNRYSDQNIDMEYTDVLMEFWRELFQFCEDGSSVSLTHESAVDDTSKRPSKRRRLGLHRSRSVVGFTSLLKGQYKLPAVYLLVSLLKETGVASDWDRLCELSHKFPTIYKTFSENDIRAGLALVGLAGISTGKPITGLSTSVLFTTYLSRIDSYGLSILSILHDATALDLYNLRASICQQILDPMNYFDWSEEYKSEIIDACAGCIDQEHPTRFVDDIQNKKQLQLHGKRRRRKIKSVDNPSVPKEVMSPGFPLIVHIQIWLLQHHVEHAAELTRKMDSSSCLDDEVKDKAWFEIWNYLLAEGRLFLDGNIETPEYLKKRDFMYTFMACQVSQKAKLVMMDFFENVANLVFDQEDASIKEKQYVLLACQQTVLRLLLKIRGLGSDTILEFVEKTQWPIEIDGHNAATDLNEWCADFLRERRNIPSTLIDETTGLIDLHGRYELEPKNVVEKDKFDSFLLPESPSVSIGFATENEIEMREECLTGVSTTTNAETEQTLYQEEVATKMLETKDVHQEETSDQNVAEEVNEEVNEDEDEDDEVVVLDSDDDDNDQEVEVEVLDLDDEDDDNDNDNADSNPHAYVDDNVDKDGDYNQYNHIVNNGQQSYEVDSEDRSTDDGDKYEYERQEQDNGESEIEILDDDDEIEEQYDSRKDLEEKIIYERGKEVETLDDNDDDDNDDDDDDSNAHACVDDDVEKDEYHNDGQDNYEVDYKERSKDDGDEYERQEPYNEEYPRTVSGQAEIEILDEEEDADDDRREEQYQSRKDPEEKNIHEHRGIEDERQEKYHAEEDPKVVDSHRREEEIVILDDDEDDDDNEDDYHREEEIESLDEDDDEEEIQRQYHAKEKPKENDYHHREKEIEISDDNGDDDDDDKSVAGEKIIDNVDNDQVGYRGNKRGVLVGHDAINSNEGLEDADDDANEIDEHNRGKVRIDTASIVRLNSDIGQTEEASSELQANDNSKGAKDETIENTTNCRDIIVQKNANIPNEFLDNEHKMGESKQDAVNEYDTTDNEEDLIEIIDKVETEITTAGGEFGDTTEEEDGNEKFRANQAAQADRRADALASNIGYASQVEDGYEPEDTHGYTEEEVSEAIHTEDEEDERMLKKKSHVNFTVTVPHNQTEQRSHTNNEEEALPQADQSLLTDGNTDHQNSREPGSDDMDMADEHTEQEDDIGGEFSELEENQESISETKLMLSRSPPPSTASVDPKTLLEFAQSAQKTHDRTRHSKEAPTTGFLHADSNSNEVELLGQMNSEAKSITQEIRADKSNALFFDADDENDATEGCKSVETEDEVLYQEVLEDTENDTDIRIDRASRKNESMAYADNEDELQADYDDDVEIDVVSTTNNDTEDKSPEETESSENNENILIDSEDKTDSVDEERKAIPAADKDVDDTVSGDATSGNDEITPSTEEAKVQEENVDSKEYDHMLDNFASNNDDDDDDLQSRTNEEDSDLGYNGEPENATKDEIRISEEALHRDGSERHEIKDAITGDIFVDGDVGRLEADANEEILSQNECDATGNSAESEARDGGVLVLSRVEDGGKVAQDNDNISEEKNVEANNQESTFNVKSIVDRSDDVYSKKKSFKDCRQFENDNKNAADISLKKARAADGICLEDVGKDISDTSFVETSKSREENKRKSIESETNLKDSEALPVPNYDQPQKEDVEDEIIESGAERDDKVLPNKDENQSVAIAVHEPESATADNAQPQKQNELHKTKDEDEVIDLGLVDCEGLTSKDENQPNTVNDNGVGVNEPESLYTTIVNVRPEIQKDNTNSGGVDQYKIDEEKYDDEAEVGKSGSGGDDEAMPSDDETKPISEGENGFVDDEETKSKGNMMEDIEGEKRNFADLKLLPTGNDGGIETIEPPGNKNVKVDVEIEIETDEYKDAMMDVEEDSRGDMMIDENNEEEEANCDIMKEDTDVETDDSMDEIPNRSSMTKDTGTNPKAVVAHTTASTKEMFTLDCKDSEDTKNRTIQEALNGNTTMNDENLDREEGDSGSSDGIVIGNQTEIEEINDNRKEEGMEFEIDTRHSESMHVNEKAGNFVISEENVDEIKEGRTSCDSSSLNEESKNSRKFNSRNNEEVDDQLDNQDDPIIENKKEDTAGDKAVSSKEDSTSKEEKEKHKNKIDGAHEEMINNHKPIDALNKEDTIDHVPKEEEELRLESENAYQYSVGDIVNLKTTHKGYYVDKARITSVNTDNTYDMKYVMTGRTKKSVKLEQIVENDKNAENGKNADPSSLALDHDEAGPSDIPEYIGGEPEKRKSTPNRRSSRKKMERTNDERSVSTSSRSIRSRQGSPATRSSKRTPKIIRKTNEEVEVGEEESIGISEGGSITSTVSRAKRVAARRSIRNKDKDDDSLSTANVTKKIKTRNGLPPRPPIESGSIGPTRRSARSKNAKNNVAENDNDEVSIHSRVSTRSRLSTTRDSKQNNNTAENDDDVSVKSRVSTRSKSSTTRGSKPENITAENDDDEVSVQSRVSTRSKPSTARGRKQEAKLPPIGEDKVDFSKMTVKELQSECREKRIAYSGLRKADLIEKLLKSID